MKKLYEIVFLQDAFDFLCTLDRKQHEKMLYVIRKSQIKPDAALFKKLNFEIWEFRLLYEGLQFRLLAFWDKTDNEQTLVIAAHGFLKKSSKVPLQELQKAIHIRTKYFEAKIKK